MKLSRLYEDAKQHPDPSKMTPEEAFNYAHEIIEDRWPEAEPIIMQDPKWAYFYARDVIEDDRWPEAEPTIIKDPGWAFWYTRNVIKDRWPEAEETIKKDPEWAYYYAYEVIKGPWPEAEPIIIQVPNLAFWYARFVIRGPWPEAEPIIKKSIWWKDYQKYVIEPWQRKQEVIKKRRGIPEENG